MDLKINSIFKIFTQNKVYNYNHPWESSIQRYTGTGFCVIIEKKKYIMTNYHVIENAVGLHIENQKCEVVFGDKMLDLAILTCPLKFAEPLDFGEAQSGNQIFVQGFPLRHRGLNITDGVIQKLTKLKFGLTKHLCFEVSAPIYGGNSGGPAFFNNKVFGVAYARNGNYNVFYVIPYFLVDFFIKMFVDKITFKFAKFDWQIADLDAGFILNRKFLISHIEGIKIHEDGQITIGDFLKYLGFKSRGTEKITFKYLIPLLQKKKVTFTIDKTPNKTLKLISSSFSFSSFLPNGKKEREKEDGKKEREEEKCGEEKGDSISFPLEDLKIVFNNPIWINFGGWIFVPITRAYNSYEEVNYPLGYVKITEMIENDLNVKYAKYNGELLDVKWNDFFETIKKLKEAFEKKSELNISFKLLYNDAVDIILKSEEQKYYESTLNKIFS